MTTTPDLPPQASDGAQIVGRVGFVALGIVHLLIGWLALQLAFGDRDDAASGSGALQHLAGQPFGRIMVWAVALGLLLLALWEFYRVITGGEEDDPDLKERLIWAGKGVVYSILAVTGIRIALSGGSSGGGGTDSKTSTVMSLPAGQFLVGLVGLAVIGVGGYLAYRGWTEKFMEKLDAEGNSGSSGQGITWLGKVGYIAKGVAYATVGSLFVYAAVTHDPKKSGGLDQALRTVLDQPFGPVLLTLIALGIGAFGLFCLARARHLDA